MVDVYTKLEKMKKLIKDKSKLIELNARKSILLLFLFVVFGLWVIFEYLDKEKERDIMMWQSQLSYISEMKVSNIEVMLNNKKNIIYSLADNPTIKLFMSQKINDMNVNESILNAQKSHVKNLIIASYLRLNLGSNKNTNNSINFNSKSEYGIVVLDSNKKIIMSSNKFDGNLDELNESVENVYKTFKPEMIEMYKTESQSLVYGYIVPVFKVQDVKPKSIAGAVIALLDPYKDLYELVESKQSITESDETVLVKKTASRISYVSPLKKPFELIHSISKIDDSLASAYVISEPTGFSEKKDYQGISVFVTGRKIKGSHWYLVQKISVSEAMQESESHQAYLMVVFGLLLVSITLIFVAIWKHSTNKRLKTLSEDLETRTSLLDSITDNITENIMLVNEDAKIEFINPSFSELISMRDDEVKGVYLKNVLGKESTDDLLSVSVEKQLKDSITLQVNESSHEYHVTKTKLESGKYNGFELYVLHEITGLRNEQRKREQLSNGIINTLVKAVDLHDPYCANHSQRTSEVAYEIGKEMGIESSSLENLKMAALLANIGKLFVSKDVLTKHDKLSKAESNELKRHIDYAVKILKDLTFNGPVVEIIAQKNERLDGSGYPEGLTEEGILIEAKILSVANAFVAMTSSRAYREGLKVDEVINILIEESGSQYDRHVVAALFHLAENKANWKNWHNVTTP